MNSDSSLYDLAQLLDSRALLTGKRGSRQALLKNVSQRLTAKALFEVIAGRRGPRGAYIKHLLRRLAGRSSVIEPELVALLSGGGAASSAARTELVPGIAHYGLFHAEIGIGQGARRLSRALETAGIPVSRHTISLPQFDSRVDFQASDELMSRHDTVLLHFNADTFLDLFDQFPLAALLQRRRIGHWVWELPILPPRWVMALGKFHEIWVPSRFVAEAVANATDKPVRIVPYPVPVEDFPQAEARSRLNLPRDAFIFLTIFDSNSYPARKNFLGVVRAYLDAFPNRGLTSPVLVIKCHGRGNRGAELQKLKDIVAGDDRMILIDKVFSEHEMTLIQAACDCLISLHRAEGFGFNIAECMAKGKSVIATDFSGNTDFTHAGNSLLVPYKMAVVGKDQYIYGGGQWWAEPDHEAAVAAIRRAASDAADVQRLAAQGRADIMRNYSFEAIGRTAKAAWEEKLEPFGG